MKEDKRGKMRPEPHRQETGQISEKNDSPKIDPTSGTTVESATNPAPPDAEPTLREKPRRGERPKLTVSEIEAAWAAIEPLVEQYRKKLWGAICRITRDPAASEDLVQEVFLRLLWVAAAPGHKVEDWTDVQSLRGFLHKIATNIALDWLRRHRRFVYPDDPGADNERTAHDRLADFAAPVLPMEDLLALWEALDRLPPEEREVIVMHDIEGLTMKEIAEIRNLPEREMWRIYYRGRRHLQEELTA